MVSMSGAVLEGQRPETRALWLTGIFLGWRLPVTVPEILPISGT